VSASIPPRPPRAALPDDDLAVCVAYVDGLLPVEQQLEFERRLSAEPELAARVRRLLETDELLRDAAHATQRETERARRRAPWVWALGLAAAAGLLIWAAASIVAPRSEPLFHAALEASHEGAREWLQDHEQLAGLSTAGLESARGGASPSNVAPERFVELAGAVERAQAQRTLAQTPTLALEAGYFLVPLRLVERSDVVVVALSAPGRAERLHQAEGLAPGEHVLPAPRFALVGEGAALRVRFQRGFLTPVGCGELQVVVAVRRASSQASSATLEERGARDRAELEAALRAQGYQTRGFTVREPR